MLLIMKRQILVNIREVSNIFWTLFFPLLLATLFHFTLGAMLDQNGMEPLSAAYVPASAAASDGNTGGRKNDPFSEYLETLDQTWLDIRLMTEEEARDALKNDEVLGIFYGGDEKSLTVGENTIYTSILSQILEIYEKNEALITRIAREHPEHLSDAVAALEAYSSSTETITFDGSSMNNVQNYFFALIAMTCLYGSFMGMYNSVGVQANASALGARLTAGCVKRYKSIAASLLSSWLISFLEVLILLFYMDVVLGDIDLSGREVRILVICAAATLYASSLGMLIGTVGSWSENLKNGIVISVSMACSFAADLMISGVKGAIETYAPVINRINPGALTTDAFYSVLVYNDTEKYFRSLILLTVFGLLLLTAAVLSMRRMRYKSI